MINKEGCIDYNTLKNLLPILTIEYLNFIINCVKGTKDEIIIKSYLRDKKIKKILES